MEDAFSNLQKQGKNNVENLMKWLKDSNIIDKTKEQEEKVRAYFSDVADQKNVPLDKFKEIMQKISGELKKNFDGISKQLAEHGPKLMQDAISGISRATSTLSSGVKDLVPPK